MLLDMSSINLISPITNVPNRNNTSQVTYITSPPSGDPEEEKEIFTSSGQGGSNRHRQAVPAPNKTCRVQTPFALRLSQQSKNSLHCTVFPRSHICDISIIPENSSCVKTFLQKELIIYSKYRANAFQKPCTPQTFLLTPANFCPLGKKSGYRTRNKCDSRSFYNL